jgi:hypothetical protein
MMRSSMSSFTNLKKYKFNRTSTEKKPPREIMKEEKNVEKK